MEGTERSEDKLRLVLIYEWTRKGAAYQKLTGEKVKLYEMVVNKWDLLSNNQNL